MVRPEAKRDGRVTVCGSPEMNASTQTICSTSMNDVVRSFIGPSLCVKSVPAVDAVCVFCQPNRSFIIAFSSLFCRECQTPSVIYFPDTVVCQIHAHGAWSKFLELQLNESSVTSIFSIFYFIRSLYGDVAKPC